MDFFSHLFKFFTTTKTHINDSSSGNPAYPEDDDKKKGKHITSSTGHGDIITKQISTSKSYKHTFVTAEERLKKELLDIRKDPPEHCSAGVIVEDDIFMWRGAIFGPSDTPFEDGVFYVSIQFPQDYPFKPPKIKFETKVYHPNIDMEGNIDLDILKENWSVAITISKMLLSICSFLDDPNADNILNPIANIYRNDKKKYDKIARAWTKTYAMD